MKLSMMPKNLTRVSDEEKFGFACKNTLQCFTHCCRKLELALTPYDVLRMKNSLGISSAEFLDRYVLIEFDEQDILPRLYLTMVDDGKESCVFVTPQGCSIYEDRPGACRAYPMGRASMRQQDNSSFTEYYVLLKEDHCKGFNEPDSQTPTEYALDQGLDQYNEMNDTLATILQHEDIRKGKQFSEKQVALYILALYDLDSFRKKLFKGAQLDDPRVVDLQNELQDDEQLLIFGIKWLHSRLFDNSQGPETCSN